MDGSKTVSIPITGGWQGYALTAAIIAVRAFQPGAAPMSEWSWWSWLLMSIPAALPFVTWTVFGSLWLLAKTIAALLEKTVSRRKP